LLAFFHQQMIILLGSNSKMAQFDTGTHDLATRQYMARQHMLERASAALIYLGIVSTFAAVTLIGCMIWLLIW
jgi:hypothetical protein